MYFPINTITAAVAVVAGGLLASQGANAQSTLVDCNQTLASLPSRASNPVLTSWFKLASSQGEVYHNMSKIFASKKKAVTIFAPIDSALAATTLSDSLTISRVIQQHTVQRYAVDPADGDYNVYDTVLYEALQWRSQVPVIVSRKGSAVTVSAGAASGKSLNVVESVKCSNGVIHLVDGVMFPPSTLNDTLRSIGYGTFADALISTVNDTSISNTTTVYDAITTKGSVYSQSFVVYVPPNSTISNLGLTGNAKSKFLRAHIADWTPYSGLITTGMQQYTKAAFGNDSFVLTFNVTGGNITVNGAKVLKADIIHKSGIIHVVDSALFNTTLFGATTSMASTNHPAFALLTFVTMVVAFVMF